MQKSPKHFVTSFVNQMLKLKVVFSATDIFLYMPQFQNGYWNMAPHGTSIWDKIQNRILPLPFMALAVLPLYANQTICFTLLRNLGSLPMIFGGLTIYSILFWAVCMCRHKNINPFFKTMSFFASITMPCFVVNPNSKFLFHTNMVSVFSHCILAITVFLIHKYTDLVDSRIQPSAYYFMVPFLLCSLVFTWLLQMISNEEFRNSITSAVVKNPFGMGWNAFNFYILKNIDGYTDILTGISFIW